VSGDETLAWWKTRKLARPFLQISSGAFGNDVRALKHVRRHEKVTRMNAPAILFEGSTDAGRAGERVVSGPDVDSTPFQRAEDEREEPGLVTDVPH
jgi:hypothetical protein